MAPYNRTVSEKISNHNHSHKHNQLTASEAKTPSELEKLNIESNEEVLRTKESIEADCLSANTNPGQPDIQMTEQCHRETRVYPHPDPDRGFVIELTDHHHHHQRQAPRSQSVIYTVITGDGLHNFCDGIAIGVAFAGSGVSGGIDG